MEDLGNYTHLQHTPQLGKNVFVAKSADIIGNVTIGDESSVWYQVVIRGDINSISIGRFSNVQDGAVIHVADKYGVSIGDHVVIGHQATVHACTIEDLCLIGMKSTILDGAIIGRGSIIGAGAVVPMGAIIPPNSLVVGVPAVVKSTISEEKLTYTKHLALKYVQLKDKYLSMNK